MVRLGPRRRVDHALDFDRALGQNRRQRTDRSEDRREHCPDDPDRQRELGDRPLILLDRYAANVPFVQELRHRIDELSAGDFERFVECRHRYRTPCFMTMSTCWRSEMYRSTSPRTAMMSA